MKKIYSILATAAIALTLGSCSEEEMFQNGGQSGMPITFSLQDKVQSKGVSMDNAELQKQGFGLFAYDTKTEKWAEFDPALPDLLKNRKVSYSGGAWTYTADNKPSLYWPENNDEMYSFFAYAPYSESVKMNENAASLTFSVADKASEMVDFVTSNAVDKTFANSDEGSVKFTMKHELTRLNFQAMLKGDLAKENIAPITIKSIKLKNTANGKLYKSATYTFSTEVEKHGTWDYKDATYMGDYDIDILKFTEDEQGVALLGSEAIPLFKDNEYLFLIPVTDGEGAGLGEKEAYIEVAYTYVNGDATPQTSGNIALPAGIMKQGKASTLTFTFDGKKVGVDANAGNDYEVEANDIATANKAFLNGATSVEIKEIGTDKIIKLPNAESEVDITLPNAGTALTIQYADNVTARPTVLHLTVAEGQTVNDLTFSNLDKTKVYINGKLAKATVNAEYLYLNKGAEVNSLVVNAGEVHVKSGATVNISEKEGQTPIINVYIENGSTVTPADAPNGYKYIDAELDTFYKTLQKGGDVEVTKEIATDVTEIDFNGLTIANDLNLMISAPIGTLKLGENTDGKNIIVEIANGVAYPKITLQGTVKNYTIKGDAKTNAPLSTTFINENANIENLTIDGIKAVDGVVFDFGGTGALPNGKNITIQNCVATDLTKTFIKMNVCTDAKILNNTISYKSTSEEEAYKHGIEIYWPSGKTLVEGNEINNANKHGLMLNHGNANEVIIKDNVFNGAVEDGIKTDHSNNVSITGNIIKQATEYGIRVDRLDGPTATVEISSNVIGAKCEKEAYGIKVYYRSNEDANKGTSVTVNLTAKDNKVGEDKIGGERYFSAEAEGMTLTGDYDFPYTIVENSHYITCKNEHGLKDFAAMKWMADEVNSKNNTFAGITVKLLNDIDMTDKTWTAVGNVSSYPSVTFAGTFDGNGKTISNMVVNAEGDGGVAAAGLFGSITGVVKNVKIDKATVTSTHYAGAICGYSSTENNMEIIDCEVTNSTITSTPELLENGNYDNGDKAGGIIGYMAASNKVTNCKVSNTTIKAYRDLGGIVGNSTGTVANCTVGEKVILIIDDSHNYKNYTNYAEYDAGSIVGEGKEGSSNTGTATIQINISDAGGLRKFATQVNSNDTSYKGKTLKLTANIDLSGEDWTPINGWDGILNGIVIDGDGHTISNMSIKGTGTDGFIGKNASSLTIKNLTFYKAIVNDKNGGNTRYAGVVIGKNYSSVTIENVHVTNSVVINDWQSGGFVGFAETNAPVFTNCSISDSFVGGSNATAGSFFGLGGVDVSLTNCKATNVKLYTDGLTWESTQKAKNNYYVGHIYGKTLTVKDCSENDVTVVAEYPEGY